MSKKTLFKVFTLWLVIGMLFSAVQAASAMTNRAEATQSLEKVEAKVLDEIASKGTSDLVIEMAEKADLSKAYAISDWNERGWFVYDTLREVAARTQKPVIEILEKNGIKYDSFFAGNEIAVYGSGLNTLTEIVALKAVDHIRFPRVAYIEPGFASIKEATVTQSSINALDWGITDTNADDFWSTFGMQGDGLVVANIDTGVQWDHPALDQAYKCSTNPTSSTCWYDPSNTCGGTVCDNNGHGTHTMGTMVGDDDPTLTYQVGMAPNAQWIACKGCESNSCSETSLNACADWIVAPGGDPNNRPNIVNNSWGGGGGDAWYLAKVNAWRAAGIFPAFSAGNSGSACGSIGSPSDYQESFATANHMSSRVISSSSSRGPSTYGDDPYTKPNISAPGTSICSSVPGSGWSCAYSGTSMAAPHVAGAVALLWSCNASLIGDMTATFEVLQDTADPPNDGGNCGAPADGEGNFTYGYGYLNVLAAGQQVCAAGTISGTVTDGIAPIEGATVSADNGAGLVVDVLTLADGSYTLNVPEDTYDVSATKYGYNEDIETGVVVTEGSTTTVDFVITPLASSMVSGYVYDGGVVGLGSHGYPLYAAIRITGTGYDETVYSDPFTGYYEIELVEDTEHTFTTTPVPGGYDPLVESVTPTGASYAHDIYVTVDDSVCAAPGYQPSYDIFYSFESSDHGFTPGGTTSFAWGDFTSGPMAGHSGIKGIATNPAGDYNASELGYMLSPVIDLSVFGTDTPVVEWWDWKHIESASFDWARLDVTKDGGTSWISVWGPVGGVSDTEYHKQTVVLDPSYNVANFQMRFYFKTDSSVQYEGWYVDDIGIFEFTAPPITTVWTEDFESDNGGLTHAGTNDEWEYGTPTTTFPGGCAEGTFCWDTDLDANYENSSNYYLMTPAIDLTGVVLPPDTSLYFKWWQALHIESATYDHATVASSTDGGTTWTTLWDHTGSTRTEAWNQKMVDISSAAGGSIQFRFTISSDSSVNYEGWSLDMFEISYQETYEIPAPVCTVIPGGVVAGYVYDLNESLPLVGADVVSLTVATQSFELADDPDNAGIYWVFQPTTTDPEDVIFTASKALFGDDVQTVTVDQDEINRQDFYLGTGQLVFDPISFEVTMDMGDPAETRTLTISNIGTSDATFELVEVDKGFLPPLSIPAFTGTLPEDDRPISIGKAIEAPNFVESNNTADLIGILTGAPAFAVQLSTDDLKYIPDTEVPGTWTQIGSTVTSMYAGDFIGGDFTTLYAVGGDDNNLYAVDTTTGAATLIGATTPPAGQSWTGLSGAPDGTMYGLVTDCSTTNLVTVDLTSGATTPLGSLTALGCGIDLAYSTTDDLIYIVDLLTDSLFSVDPATMTTTMIGALGASPNYAQGMDFEEESGVLYWAAYTGTGELRIIDTTTGASTLVGTFPGGVEVDSLAFTTGGSADISWLTEEPVSGTVSTTTPVPVTLTFDPTGAGLGQPGDYLGQLKIKHNTPYTYPNIMLTLHLIAPLDHGTFNGIVTGLEACDINPGPLEGATVNFWQGTTIIGSTTTNEVGYYSFALPTGTYDIEFIMDGYVTDYAEEVVLPATETITVDMELRLEAPCVSVSPTSLEQTLPIDATEDQTLTLVNTGAGDATFELFERDEGYIAPVSIPPFTGTLPEDTRPISMGLAPNASHLPSQEKPFDMGVLVGAPAFAIDIYPGYNLVNIPDTEVPGTWNIIGSVSGNDFFAGDFVGGDFSTLYAIDYNTNQLYAIDTTTAVKTLIGTTTPPAGQTFSGLTGTPDGTMYGLVTNCSTSNLVIVDVATGATTLLGSLAGVGCGIDLAYSTVDDMIYIVDLLTDSLFRIDPSTVTATLVGSLGASANYAQGMDFEEESGVLYWAAYTSAGELRIIDTETGASTLVGGFPSGAETDCLAFPTGGSSDVPWLSEDPVSGAIPADGSTDVTVTFNSTGLIEGDYMATLRIKVVGAPQIDVPVTLHVGGWKSIYLPLILK